MDPSARPDESNSDDDVASQTTEDDPEIPENHEVPPQVPVQQPNGQTAPVVPPPVASAREKPHYELRHTMRGHTKSLAAVKFSPDGTILASCGS